MSLKTIFFRKKNKYNLIFLSTCYLASLINERSHNTLSLFDEGVIGQIFSAKVLLYGFGSDFFLLIF